VAEVIEVDTPVDEVIAVADAGVVDVAGDGEATRPSEATGTGAWPWLLGVWLAGSVLLATVEGIRLVRLTRRTRAASAADATLTSRVAQHAARMGITPVPIVLVQGARAPSVWGLTRPRILWPATLQSDVPEIGTDGLIVHELAHVKRRDHLVGWIELMAGVIWWWNPLFWSVRSALREQAELACDAWVIAALPDGRRAYAESLLALSSERVSSVPLSMAVVGISATTRRALERRLVMIMQGRTSLRLTFVGICTLAVVAAVTLPTWAASPQVPQPPVVAAAPAPPAVPSAPASVPPVVQAPTLRSVVTQSRPAPPPPPPPPPVMGVRGRGNVMATLPEPARALADAFAKDQQAYIEEMTQKVTARRATFTAEMQRLQDELAKAGNLDDAVAIRDYLRRAAPSVELRPTVRGGRGGAATPVTGRGRAGGGR
jgi:beta-lactamase regulating signal transducer with metallopeptidase domain